MTRQAMTGRALRGSLGFCVLALLTGGCSGDDEPRDPAATMVRVAEVAQGDDATFAIDITGSDPEDGYTAEGAIHVGASPALRMTSRGTDPTDRPGLLDYVVLDGTVYGRSFGADDGGLAERYPWLGVVPTWESVPVDNPDDDRGFDVGDFLFTFGGKDDLDPREYALAAAAGAVLRSDGTEQVDGEGTTRYVGDVEADRLRAAPGVEPDVRDLLLGRLEEVGEAAQAELWIDEEYRLRRFVLTSGENTLRMHFREVGRKVEIVPPSPEDLVRLTELGTEGTDAILRARLERRYGAECGADQFERYRGGEAPPRVDILQPCTS